MGKEKEDVVLKPVRLPERKKEKDTSQSKTGQ